MPFGLVWAISAGVRWDARRLLRARSGCGRCGASAGGCGWPAVGLAAVVVVAWAVPMVLLSGGWDVYRQALADYLQVWSPQSAYVVGDFASGGDTQATYNLNFLIDYLRQMLGIGLLLVLYLLGRRFGPARLAADYRSRFLGVWVVPPLVVYVFAHLGEPGYVLSLAPAGQHPDRPGDLRPARRDGPGRPASCAPAAGAGCRRRGWSASAWPRC